MQKLFPLGIVSLLGLFVVAFACSSSPVEGGTGGAGGLDKTRAPGIEPQVKDGVAIFAGGCFWCMEASLEHVDGVKQVVSGFIGGTKKDPSYEEVGNGGTGHAEAVRVEYDPARLSYDQLLDIFWHNIDPTQANGQFCDLGDQYRSAIFYLGEQQQAKAEASKKKIVESKRFLAPIVTEIVPATTFYPAENYHQDFYKKDPIRYKTYRYGCGRDARLETLWGKN